MYLFRRDFFTVLDGMNFFKEFSLLHLLWGVWVVDMTLQIIPIKNKVPLGSQKFFFQSFQTYTGKDQLRGAAKLHRIHHKSGL